jgi:hypothetical protein
MTILSQISVWKNYKSSWRWSIRFDSLFVMEGFTSPLSRQNIDRGIK